MREPVSKQISSELEARLKQHFGFSSFRPHQREIVEATLAGRDVFAALPTGGGKSLCYQLPALLQNGLTVVVSPLISLMKDQVDGARENGLPAVFLNSSLSADQARDTWRQLAAGRVRLLYASPERLALPEFRAAVRRIGLSLVAVDEAHCISEWGHEFRPEYRSLGLLREEFPEVPIAAFTATATRQVQSDVIRLLGLKEPFVVRASFNRPEIFYRVLRKADVDEQIWEFVAAHPGEPGIVYRGTRKATEGTADYLAGRGLTAVAYHAGLDDETRRLRQEAFVRDEAGVVVATIAFGMGIDKSNVRWVIHGDLPRSLEGYYQETGRAARDGEPAETILFYGPGDIAALRWHIKRTESPVERDRAELRLREVLRYVDSGVCRRRQLLAHFDEAFEGDCGRCDVCAGEVRMEDATESARMVLSAVIRTGERFGAHHLADVVVGEPTDKVMERGHERLPTFGVGRDRPRSYWLSLVQDLAGAGYLARGEGRTAGFRLTPKGRLLLHGKDRFLAPERIVPAPRGAGGKNARAGGGAGESRGEQSAHADARAVRGAPAGAVSGAMDPTPADQLALFQALKQLRKRIAFRRNVPPYVVFSDKTLRIMAASRPTDRAGLLRCHGVGDRKLEAYGDEFIATIREFLETP
jgi:ATP-dependent DNA helicase RecQ